MSRPARSRDRGGPVAFVLFVALLIAGALLRAQVIRSIPEFFGPGDPAIYFGMARGVLHHGLARVDFIHHYLARPNAISHLEDYYEPAFAYLPALAMAIGGQTQAAAASTSLVMGLACVCLIWALARRHGAWVALIAAAIVALEPWSIYYSGVLMKEATVSVLVLGYAWLLYRGVSLERPSWQSGTVLGLATIFVSLFQYELIPILGLTSIVVLARHRTSALGAYLISSGIALALLAGVTWIQSGVLISAKYAFVLGRVPGDPDQVAHAAAGGERSLLPFSYMGRSVLLLWYPTLLMLGLLGSTSVRVDRVERTILITLVAFHLYLHAIPQDLWARDFIVLTAILARPAALALTEGAAWWSDRRRATIAWTLLFFLWVAPWLARLLIGRFAPGVAWGFWTNIAIDLALAMPVGVLAFSTARSRWAQAWSPLIPIVVGVALVADYALTLPYSSIYRNAEFPTFEIERARRERVSRWMAGVVPRGPVLARHPEEVESYSGFPAVVMPEVFRPGGVRRVEARYGIRYLLDEPGSIPDSVLAELPLRQVGEREAVRLFEFTR